jgi:CubicO group peptidase (beta-lactamase class C family)
MPLAMKSASTGHVAFFASPDHVSVHMMGRYPDNTTGPVVKDIWDFNDFVTPMGPAGGINANVKDMATWAIFQLGNGTYDGKRLISPENMTYMHSPKTPVGDAMPATKIYYCTGWMYEEPPDSLPSMVWHNGATFGNHAMVLLVPDENLGIVVLSNVSDPPLPDQLARTFYNRYFGREDPDLPAAEALQKFRNETEEEYLSPAPIRPADATEPRALSAYTGSYTSDIYGTATVAEQDGNLTVTFSKKAVVYDLTPWDGNIFFATCPAWNDDFHDFVTFDTGADGSIRQMVLPIVANPPYTGTFVRV